MLSSNANITVPLRSRSSAGGTWKGCAQKCQRQPEGEFFTRFLGRGTLLVLTAIISGLVCYSAVGAPPTTARGSAPTAGAAHDAWPKAAGNSPDEATAAAWVPREPETASPGGKVYEFPTSSKGGDSKHPSLRAPHGHAAGGTAPRDGGSVKGSTKYTEASENNGVDIDDEDDDLEAKAYVAGVSGEGAKKKRLRTTGGEKGPGVWRVPVHTSKGVIEEEEVEDEEEETNRGKEDGVKTARKGKKLHTEGKGKKTQEDKDDDRGDDDKMAEEEEDVKPEGKEEQEEGGKEEYSESALKNKAGKGGHAGIVEESEKKKEGDEVTTEAKTGTDKDVVKKVEDTEVEGALGLVRTLSLLEKARQMLEKPLLPEQLMPLYSEHPLCLGGSSRWCGKETKGNEGTPSYTFREMMRPLDALVWSIFKLPLFDIPFPFPSIQSAERAGPVQASGECRYVFTVDLLPPLDDVRLYVTPSERQVGLTADRKMRRSEEGKAFSRVYGTETRLHAVASIAEGCMVSEKLVKAGLIGWSYAGKSDGGIEILVAFPSDAHAKKLIEQKELTEDAYKHLADEEDLEQLKPAEKCLLSGRTQSECDQLKAEAGGKHETALTVSTEGYEENQIRLPEFVYA